MDRRARGTASITDEGQARESSTLVEKLFVGEAAKAKILPPGSLLLAAVPVEDIGKKPPRLLLGGSFGGVKRDALRKARYQIGNLQLPIAQCLAYGAIVGDRPRNGRTACHGG